LFFVYFQNKPSRYHGSYKNYSPDALDNAYKKVTTTKVSIRRVCMEYGIPYNTLRDRVRGKVDHDNIGNTAIFSMEEEEAIINHAENRAKLGYGMSNTEMQRTAGELALHLGKRSTDKPLSNCWLYGFLERYVNI
jgi:transposase-like protein